MSELQSPVTIEKELIDCTAEKRKKVEVTVIAKWPSMEERKNLPEDVTSLGKTLVQGTYKQIANAVWKNEKKIKRNDAASEKRGRARVYTFMLQEESQLFEKDRQRTGFFYGETLFRGRGQGTNATHRFVSCCYQ